MLKEQDIASDAILFGCTVTIDFCGMRGAKLTAGSDRRNYNVLPTNNL